MGERGAGKRRGLKGAAAAAVVLAGLWLARRPLPPPHQDLVDASPPADSYANTTDTTLGRAVAEGRPQDADPGLSGIYTLADGRDAFVARAMLVDTAERTIDVQYYIWHDDTAGRLLLQGLRRAADRGVRIRLLLDDNNTAGLDPILRGLDAHATIEVRLFNPFMHRRARPVDFVTDFGRTNRRMHNKSFTVDHQATIVGGRNMGDEYFDAGQGTMFADLDVLAVGPVVEEVSEDFERYWTSASTYPAASILRPGPSEDVGTEPSTDPDTQTYLHALSHSTLWQHLQSGRLAFTWAPTRVVSDDPAKGLGRAAKKNLVVTPLGAELDQARQSALIVSPYFVPTRQGVRTLVGLVRRGAHVSVLTNALSATDVAAVHAGYIPYREALLRGGVELYEMKRDATVVEPPGGGHLLGSGGRLSSGGSSLHAKTFAVDGRVLFVGSFNMDPRSARLNTEMGVLIDSPELAGELAIAKAESAGTLSYHVTLGADGLVWTSEEDGQTVRYTSDPHTHWIQRAGVRVLSWLPIDGLL
ncbi:phospholipase D family protein [Janibacter sp. GXQ6167]|uniref:phospholipase D family protein n=1 Tax=Janibacter sp. GXQ6167 TaxID=3240791 RepID=UPI003524CF6F